MLPDGFVHGTVQRKPGKDCPTCMDQHTGDSGKSHGLSTRCRSRSHVQQEQLLKITVEIRGFVPKPNNIFPTY